MFALRYKCTSYVSGMEIAKPVPGLPRLLNCCSDRRRTIIWKSVRFAVVRSDVNAVKSVQRAVIGVCESISTRRNRMKAVELNRSALARKVFLHLCLLVALLTGLGSKALAQSTAALNGTVTDATGAIVPNAKVVATNQATGVESDTQTDAAGTYLFPSLPIGVYRIQVTARGFQTAAISTLKLDVATALTQNVQLKLGETSETVEIVADAALVDTATT